MNVFDGPVQYDWVMWADCDAFFMDPGRTIDSVQEILMKIEEMMPKFSNLIEKFILEAAALKS